MTTTDPRRTRAFHHYTVGGELRVEQEEVLSEQVEEVACRWCGNGRAVVTTRWQSSRLVSAPTATSGAPSATARTRSGSAMAPAPDGSWSVRSTEVSSSRAQNR